MKKIAIVTNKMVIGGIEKSLIDLLHVLNESYEITIYLMELGGDFFDLIPNNVKIKKIPGLSNFKQMFWKRIQKLDFMGILRLVKHRINLMHMSFVDECESLSGILPKICEKYDYAIAYSTPVSFPLIYVINNLNAQHKFAWIHNEVDGLTINIQEVKEYYQQIEKIICVSIKAKEKFDLQFSNLKERSVIINNIINRKYILEAANEIIDDMDISEEKIILTVGRVCKEKGQDIIPEIVEEVIKKTNIPFKWYCIGDGIIKDEIQEKVTQKELDKYIKFLGSKKNPYPYFKQADLYVQVSRLDGYCITLAEARCFELPIISTKFAGVDDQLVNGETGYIIDFDVSKLSNAIVDLLEDEKQRKKFSQNLKHYHNNDVSKMRALFGDK